jgi:FtsH-binding integral membrane protein
MPNDAHVQPPEVSEPVFGERHADSAVLARVMLLVGVATGLLALGAFAGRDLSAGGGLACSFAALGMLVVQFFGGERFSIGGSAVLWLFAVAAVIGLGLGPVLADFALAEPAAIARAAAATALVAAVVGAGGLALRRNLAGWTAPISLALMSLIFVSLLRVLFGTGGSRFLTLAIAGMSGLLILIDFNFRRHRPTDHVAVLATGIAVAGVNLFMSVLNLIGQA